MECIDANYFHRAIRRRDSVAIKSKKPVMSKQELLPHLFRTEFTKMVAVLCRQFGIGQMKWAEDIASDTFLAALETWSYKGVPENAVAWLYSVARNKAINSAKRERIFSGKVAPALSREIEPGTLPEIDLTDENIRDSQLRLLFAVCHPAIPPASQIGLALRILCGFGIDEIASAFLTNRETIQKRLFRARERLRMEQISVDLPGEKEIQDRLQPVLATLYLLFNEGYYSETNDNIIRQEFCQEAMRLTQLLINNKTTDLPEVNALLALMCFHASRFEARKKTDGEYILYDEQDESLWDLELISRGAFYLHRSSTGNEVTKYHLEASIAFWHTQKADTREKWENILLLYNLLLAREHSVIAALNRAFVISKLNGREEAIREAEKLNLVNNPYYFALLAELYTGKDDRKALENIEKARSLARTKTDRELLQKKSDHIRHRQK
jgi:RNA polymerase sigma-70 factor (ECF subfamily)